MTTIKLTRAAVVVILAAVFQATGLQAETVTLMPVADTGLFQNAPNNNLGAQTFVPVGTTFQSTVNRGLFRFDLSQIPPGAEITGATLTFRVVQDNSTNPTLALHRMLQSWNEGTKSGGPGLGNVGAPATAGEPSWNHRSAPSTAWGTPGGQAGTDFASAESGTAVASAGIITFSGASLISDIETFVANPGANFGWMLKHQTEGSPILGARRIATREDLANAPSLVVDYNVSAPPPEITTASPLPGGMVGLAYSQTLAASSGTPPYTWSVFSGTLPGGLALTGEGVLSGTPTGSGEFDFVIRVTDGASASADKNFALTISPRPAITQAGIVNDQFELRFTAEAGQGYAVEFRGAVDAGTWDTLTSISPPAVTTTIVVTDSLSAGTRFYRIRAP